MLVHRVACVACPALACLFLLVPAPAVFSDTLKLRDGSRLEGTLNDLGGNAVTLRLERGRKTIFKKDIVDLELTYHDDEAQALTEDLVICRSGVDLRGKVTISPDGGAVTVALADGNQVSVPASKVLSVVFKGQETESGEFTLSFTRRTEASIRDAIEAAASADEKAAGEATARLKSLGMLALPQVERARAALESAAPDDAVAARRRRALDDVVGLHDLKKVMPESVEQFEPRIYEILEAGETIEREKVLSLVLTRFPDDCFDLCKLLLFREDEEPAVRATVVGILGGLFRNRELLELYRTSAGQTQLSLAIALGKNRILIGAPTLVQALEMEDRDIRRLAFESLREFTGQDFGYHYDDTPLARRRAIVAWNEWWRKSSAVINEQGAAILENKPVETELQKRARDLWLRAGVAFREQRYEETEALLRQAIATDPIFYNASIQLAALLYGQLGRTDDAYQILEDLQRRRMIGVRDKDLAWVHYHLGRVAEIRGKDTEALEYFRRCVRDDPAFLVAYRAEADLAYTIAVRGKDLDPTQRRGYLDQAAKAYTTCIEQIDQKQRDLIIIAIEDLPVNDAPPFDMRDHNRTVLGVRAALRLVRARASLGKARIASLIGDKQAAVVNIVDGVSSIQEESSDESRALLIEMKTYLGTLYESIGEFASALREYRIVTAQLDPTNAAALEGIARLQGRVRHEPARGPASLRPQGAAPRARD